VAKEGTGGNPRTAFFGKNDRSTRPGLRRRETLAGAGGQDNEPMGPVRGAAKYKNKAECGTGTGQRVSGQTGEKRPVTRVSWKKSTEREKEMTQKEIKTSTNRRKPGCEPVEGRTIQA